MIGVTLEIFERRVLPARSLARARRRWSWSALPWHRTWRATSRVHSCWCCPACTLRYRGHTIGPTWTSTAGSQGKRVIATLSAFIGETNDTSPNRCVSAFSFVCLCFHNVISLDDKADESSAAASIHWRFTVYLFVRRFGNREHLRVQDLILASCVLLVTSVALFALARQVIWFPGFFYQFLASLPLYALALP